jgi:Caspase domain
VSHDRDPAFAPASAGWPRRHVLQGAGALLGASAWPGLLAQERSVGSGDIGPEPPRLALLIGNRDYPGGEDLPPIHKNVRDVRAVLEKRGFNCTDGLDLDTARARTAIAEFAAKVRAAPAEATVVFYFSGHGAQLDSENLLVSAKVNPKAAPAELLRGSIKLTSDVLGVLPNRPQGLTISIVDACRTSLVAAAGDSGLNQVEAPLGNLIAFATGAGRPAIAPADDSRNTFYTASLIKVMADSSDEISWQDMFRLVKFDVQNVMLNHPVQLLRQFAQFPFIAENTRIRRRLAPRPEPSKVEAAKPPPPVFNSRNEEADFAALDAALLPREIFNLALDFLKNHPRSRLAGSATVARLGAEEARTRIALPEVTLTAAAFERAAGLTPEVIVELAKAGRGDKDAAARIGRSFAPSGARGDATRYEGWLRYATALGNGIASYELALFYRRNGQPLFAAQYEARARALGYTPPPSLDNTRK